ncbi:uncharacterized protein [Nothobranchius furzeri]|uniref:Transcript variant X2 n=1 Tax=Nothobranchius furzeri TaxID=105023 RepID=A0A9D2XE85_NOTFU|nr:transcript variant X2 [Nothobranchius furzeri]
MVLEFPFLDFCRSCSRIREVQIERQAHLRREQGSQLRSIYFIPFPRSVSRQDSEDLHGVEFPTPPQYGTNAYFDAPPSYNELGVKPDDLPPLYTESNFSEFSTTLPPTHTSTVSSQDYP